jgi:hypothetical protein
MKNVTLAAILSCVVFGSYCQGQVPVDVEVRRYDIGLMEDAEVAPADKGDVVVVIGAKWCRPCMLMYPQWALLRSQGYRVVYIDYDKPEWSPKRPEDEAIVKLFWEKRDRTVPDVYVYNTDTEEVVAEWHQRVGVTKIKETLWKKSSSKGFLPELRR